MNASNSFKSTYKIKKKNTVSFLSHFLKIASAVTQSEKSLDDNFPDFPETSQSTYFYRGFV